MKMTLTLTLDDDSEIVTEELPVDRATLALVTHAVSQLMGEPIEPPPRNWETETTAEDTKRVILAWIHLTSAAMLHEPEPTRELN